MSLLFVPRVDVCGERIRYFIEIMSSRAIKLEALVIDGEFNEHVGGELNLHGD